MVKHAAWVSGTLTAVDSIASDDRITVVRNGVTMVITGALLNSLFGSLIDLIYAADGNVGIGEESPTAALHVKAKSDGVLDFRGILIEAETDTEFREAITIKGGSTATTRRYIEWQGFDGGRTNLFGFNADSSMIAWDAVNGYHHFSALHGGVFQINAAPGAFGVVIGQDTQSDTAVGSGGLEVRDGTIGNTHPTGTYGRINSVGVEVFNGRYIQSWSPDNGNYIRQYALNGKGYIRSSEDLEIFSGTDTIVFSNASTTDRITWDMDGQVYTFDGIVKNTVYAVSGLPSASTVGAGARAIVSDANSPTLGATVAGSGSTYCGVISDGTNWIVG